MVIFSNENDDLTNRDIKFLIGTFTIVTGATVLGLYLYNDIIKPYQTRKYNQQYYGQMNLISNKI